MASTIKVTNIDTPDGTGSITIDRPTVLQAGDIITADIAADAVDGTKLADNACDSEHYTDGSVDNAHLATGIDAAKLTGTLPAIDGASLTGISTGAKGADIASASTVVVGTDGGYFDITGTTGISTQFTVAAGRTFTLQFDGAVVITDNAAITLAGAANFTTAAGDILTFTAVAANTVVQTGYSLVDGGSPIAAAGGKLLQVVSFTFSTTLSTTSSSFISSGLTASITPAATSSKILITAGLTLYLDRTGDQPIMTLFRGTVSGTNLGHTDWGFAYHDIGGPVGSGTREGWVGVNYLDSPSTTSSQAYTIGVRSTTGTMIVGRNNVYSTITLMEIGV